MRILSDIHDSKQPDFVLHDDFLFRGNRLCVLDCSLRLQIIQDLHNEGHVGRDQTLQLMVDSYFWPALHLDVEHFFERYRIC